MNKMRLGILGVAALSAVLAGVLAKSFLSQKSGVVVKEVSTVEASEVLIAASELAMGSKLSQDNLEWKSWPRSMIIAGMIEKTPQNESSYVGKRVRQPLVKGEPILESKLIQSNAGFMAAVIPQGYRAIAVPVTAETGAGGFILPQDRVDVIALRDKGQAAQQATIKQVAETILSNVKVLAIDQTFQTNDKGEQTVVGKTATLELNPRQAEVLALFSKGTAALTLSLRSLSEGDSKSEQEKNSPVLLEKYSKGMGDGFVTYRYGVPKVSE